MNNRRGEACLARHRGMIKAAIQKIFADRLFILTVSNKMGKFIHEQVVGA